MYHCVGALKAARVGVPFRIGIYHYKADGKNTVGYDFGSIHSVTVVYIWMQL